jgi:predicted SAM-dependent methyltransferase
MKKFLKKIFGKPAVSLTPLQQLVAKQKDIRIVVGSGGLVPPAGWIATEVTSLDVTDQKNWDFLLKKRTVSNVFAEHVWEHLTPQQADLGNKNIFQYLKTGGRFRLAVPDGLHPDPDYINHVKIGGTGPGADDHKVLYTYKTLRESLQIAGFDVVLLEYWDENGKFHFTEWSTDHGKVMRSKCFDQRNAAGELKYTSLIIDAVKPYA